MLKLGHIKKLEKYKNLEAFINQPLQNFKKGQN